MKKFFNFIKNKKDDAQTDEEIKEEELHDHDNSTKDKDSNSDENSREAKLEEIKKSMLEKKVKKFEGILSHKIIDLD